MTAYQNLKGEIDMNLYKYFHTEEGINASGLTIASSFNEALEKVIKLYNLDLPFNGELITIVELFKGSNLNGLLQNSTFELESYEWGTTDYVDNTLDAMSYELTEGFIISREESIIIY